MVVRIQKDDMQSNIQDIMKRIESAADRSGRSSDDITLVAVSKFHPVEQLYMALDCGITILGENRVQEREEKASVWARENPRWHMLGHLQRNKARKALELFDCIESVDSLALALTLERIIKENRESGTFTDDSYRVFIEVNTSGENSKEGAAPEGALKLVEEVLAGSPNLKIDGLMTIGPLAGGEREIRRSFSMLRELRELVRKECGIECRHLSMGMSGDFEMAIEEGSTLVRVGTGIFGERIRNRV